MGGREAIIFEFGIPSSNQNSVGIHFRLGRYLITVSSAGDNRSKDISLIHGFKSHCGK